MKEAIKLPFWSLYNKYTSRNKSTRAVSERAYSSYGNTYVTTDMGEELESLYNINSSIKKTVNSSLEYFVESSNNSIDIKISKRSIVFFKFSNLSLSIPSRQGYKVDRLCYANQKANKIVVLSRRKLLGRPKRWVNEEMCINKISGDCVVIDPQEMTQEAYLH